MNPGIYLAGPTVFCIDAEERGKALKAVSAQHGCLGLYPLDSELPASVHGADAARFIHDACLSMLKRADAVVADLSPFRGPHVDDGTAFELGFARALGLPVFGYSIDRRPLIERVPRARTFRDGSPRDASGWLIEDFGQPFNAMIAGAVMSLDGTPEEAIARAATHVLTRPGRSDRE